MQRNVTIVIICLLALAATLYCARGGVIGWDFTFHVDIAGQWLAGTVPYFHHGAYPPLFHWFLAGLIALNILTPVSLAVQVLAYPAIILSTAYLSYRIYGNDHATITALIMFSSFAVFDRAQVIPQTIDMIFLPIGMLFFTQKRTWKTIGSFAVSAYSHGPFSMPLLGGALYRAWRRPEYRKLAILMLIVLIPVLVMVALNLQNLLLFSSGANNPQETYALNDPVWFICYMGVVPFGVMLFSLAYLGMKRRLFTGLNGMMFAWLLATLPLLFVMIDRFASYSIPAIAILGASSLEGVYKKFRIPFIVWMLLLAFATSYVHIWML